MIGIIGFTEYRPCIGRFFLAVVENLRKAAQKFARMSSILVREGVDARTSGTFYKAVVQAVLLLISETWVMTPQIGLTLGVFYHRVAHRLAGMQLKINAEGRCQYTPLA